MNDRLKYRLWNKAEHKYENLNDVDLNLYLDSDGSVMLLSESEITYVGYCYILEQCIGLKDINGFFIYEGDILSFEFENNEFINLVVKWDQENCRFGFEENGNVWDWEDIVDSVKVVGNINENSYLINLRYFKYDGVEVKL